MILIITCFDLRQAQTTLRCGNPILERAGSGTASPLNMRGRCRDRHPAPPGQAQRAIRRWLIDAIRNAFVLPAETGGRRDRTARAALLCADWTCRPSKATPAQGVHALARVARRAWRAVQLGTVPVIAALHGAVVVADWNWPAQCHIRVADETTSYAPARRPRAASSSAAAAPVRMPTTDRRGPHDRHDADRAASYNAVDGERIGVRPVPGVPRAPAFDKALESGPAQVAQQRPADQLRLDARPAPHRRAAGRPRPRSTEALMASIAQQRPEAKARVRAFLEGRAGQGRKESIATSAPPSANTSDRPSCRRRRAAPWRRHARADGPPGIRYRAPNRRCTSVPRHA
jgi:hypothetical protein